MNDRLWIVQAQFNDGTWAICDFGLGKFASTNFYEAHKIKREQQMYLQTHGNRKWFKKCFRVVEYEYPPEYTRPC